MDVETTEKVATAEAQMARAAITVNGVPIIIHTVAVICAVAKEPVASQSDCAGDGLE